ncbi:Nucleotide-binding universal stress protein, UspA family [Jatrophihabitans endophyticus]|uniref:Nucleotide-binding universal stress protein, UspA family n=1 Tax=Jatrophihabitans endophyticus TaxID=1206085 RepID=A0A1M5KUT5_9ACTN|nr:universal stress protein [Jatrophihabitans endophyticus]SHG56554.1 Nucleotide-binding universal stress protein, UspA family [Jatrophihabitans endophyticus]
MTAPERATATEPTPDRVVVGIDGAPPSKMALRWAVFLAETLGCRVHAISTWQQPAGWAAAGGITGTVDWAPEQDTLQTLTSTIREVLGDHPPVPVVAEVEQGGAARTLIDASRNARMLVVGSRGHGGFTGLLLGSVSSACAEHAHCPVTVVHGEALPPNAG